MSEIDVLKAQLESLQANALAAFAVADDLAALQQLRVHYLGKKGALTEVLKGVGKLPPAERPVIGQHVNKTKSALSEALEKNEAELAVRAKSARIEAERVDVSLPGR